MGLPGKHWQEPDGWHIDVRGLVSPEPMVAILGRIETVDQDGTITVHHDREPIYLYPELAERGWQHRIVDSDAGEVRLILTRQP